MTTIIVPSYNSIRSLKNCVDSVHQQTVLDWELILVDDGSTDGSGELCDRLAEDDGRIRVLHKQNGGVSSARNAGIEIAVGEHITFCDSDDYLEPDYLELLLRTKETNPDCGHIWCCFQTVSGYQKENAAPNYSGEDGVLHATLQEYMSLHELCLDTSPWNKLFCTDIIKKNGIRFPEDLSLGEDWLFNLNYIDASRNDRIAVITKPLYNYLRGNEDSLDSKYRADLPEIYCRLTNACIDRLKRWDVPAEQIEKFYNSCFYMNENVLRNTLRAPDKSIREKIKWNSAFMRSAEFRDVLQKRTCFVHPLYLAAYGSGYYSNVLIVKRLTEFSRMLKRGRRQRNTLQRKEV